MRTLTHPRRMAGLTAAACIAVLGGLSATCLAQTEAGRGYRDVSSPDGDYNRGGYNAERNYNSTREYQQRESRDNEQQRYDRRDSQMRDSRDRDSRAGDQGNRDAGLGVGIARGERGVRVNEVKQGSPAEEAGLERGDEIVSVDGDRVSEPQQLVRAIRDQNPGDRVEIRIRRDGQERTLTATLDPRREALNRDQQDRRMRASNRAMSPYASQRGDSSRRQYYRGATPWGDDQLQQHVDSLERQVRRMEREIQDLRNMLSNRPDRDYQMTSGQRGQNDRSREQYDSRTSRDRRDYSSSDRDRREDARAGAQRDRDWNDSDRNWDDSNRDRGAQDRNRQDENRSRNQRDDRDND